MSKHREILPEKETVMTSPAVPTPGKTTAGTFLGREPLLWTNMVRAVLYVLILLNVIVLTDVQLIGVLAAVEAVLYWLTRTQTTPNVSVVERAAHGVIYSGPANETVAAGAVVRRVGENIDGEPIGALATAAPAVMNVYAEAAEAYHPAEVRDMAYVRGSMGAGFDYESQTDENQNG